MGLSVSLVEVPLLSPFANSLGKTATRKALIFRLVQNGTEAFSECVTDEAPSSTGEDNSGAIEVISRVLGRNVRGQSTPEEFLQASTRVKGNQMAKAAIEMLLWDYHAKAQGLPLDKVIGGSRGYAEAGVALGLGSPKEVRSWVGAAVARGYKRVKVKIGRDEPLGSLRRIRDSFPEIPLSADANGCFELGRDLSTLKGLDRFELEYVEQPLGFRDLRDHSRLAKLISTPICLDESVTGPKQAREVVELEAASVINIKPGRVGGLGPALKVIKVAKEGGLHIWIGGMLETGVGRAFNVALASQREVDLPGDTSPNDRYFARDIVRNPFVMKAGRLRPNKGPGIGVRMDTEFLANVTLRTWDVF